MYYLNRPKFLKIQCYDNMSFTTTLLNCTKEIILKFFNVRHLFMSRLYQKRKKVNFLSFFLKTIIKLVIILSASEEYDTNKLLFPLVLYYTFHEL